MHASNVWLRSLTRSVHKASSQTSVVLFSHAAKEGKHMCEHIVHKSTAQKQDIDARVIHLWFVRFFFPPCCRLQNQVYISSASWNKHLNIYSRLVHFPWSSSTDNFTREMGGCDRAGEIKQESLGVYSSSYTRLMRDKTGVLTLRLPNKKNEYKGTERAPCMLMSSGMSWLQSSNAMSSIVTSQWSAFLRTSSSCDNINEHHWSFKMRKHEPEGKRSNNIIVCWLCQILHGRPLDASAFANDFGNQPCRRWSKRRRLRRTGGCELVSSRQGYPKTHVFHPARA